MSAGKYDIVIDKGSTWGVTLVLKQANKLPFNLTGYTGEGKIRGTMEDPVSVASFTVVISEPLEGKISLSLSASTTSSLTIARGVYDFKIIAPNTEVTRILQGKVQVNEEVSREDLVVTPPIEE